MALKHLKRMSISRMITSAKQIPFVSHIDSFCRYNQTELPVIISFQGSVNAVKQEVRFPETVFFWERK